MRTISWAAAVCGALGLLAVAQAQTVGAFGQAFRAARANDAEFQAARHELAANEQAIPIARAGLLPSIGASISDVRVKGQREAPNFLGQEFTQELDYRSPQASLQLRQPLLNLEAIHRLQSARSQVDGARTTYASRGYELVDRLGTAYAQRLLAEEVVVLAQAQVDAIKAQSEMAQRRLVAGEGTRTEVAEAAASLAVARVTLLEASDQRDLAQRTLVRITGEETLPLRGLSEDLMPPPLAYEGLQAWIDASSANNPNIQTRRYTVEAARYDVHRNRAGHFPRVDLVASASDFRNDSVTTLNQQTRQFSAGIQVSIPLFSGGGVDASVSQALAQVSKAEADLEAALRSTAVEVQRQYQTIQSGRSKVAALEEARSSSAIALEGTKRGMTAGLRTNADVLDAERRLFQARRDLVQARYELLLARLRLQALAGFPVEAIVQDVDRQLSNPSAGTVTAAITDR